MIELEALSVRYGTLPALEGIALRVAPGEFVLVSGRSGCGKTTLARVVAGLVPAVIPAHVEGHVKVSGLDPTRTPAASLAKHVGMVFQNPATQLFCLTVEEEVAFGPRNLGFDEQQVRERVDWALGATGLADMRRRAPFELSGGGQQRLAIAAALALRPPVLVLDEPLASLDREGARQVLRTLAELSGIHGVTVLMIEHRLAEAARVASRIVLMDRGRIVADGPAAIVSADHARLAELGLAPDEAQPSGRPHATGSAADGLALVELHHVSAAYNGRTVLADINLRLDSGEFVALVGENGSGKTTLARVLAGLMRPRSGRRVVRSGVRTEPGRGIGLLAQNPLDQLLTERVDDEVALGPRNWALFDERAHEATLAAADLGGLRGRAPLSLSVGQQQRTVLAATLALRPGLLILDEPTLGQDWAHLKRLMDFVAELNELGSTILLITHDHDLAARYARRQLLMRDGAIVADGELTELDEVGA